MSPLREWFARSEPPLRAPLGLALGFHTSADEAVRSIIEREVRQSIRWVIHTDEVIAFLPGQSGSPHVEPYIDSPVPEAIHVARRLQAGADEQSVDFLPVFRLLMTMLDCGGGQVIEDPGGVQIEDVPDGMGD
jgi:hypothetical protein